MQIRRDLIALNLALVTLAGCSSSLRPPEQQAGRSVPFNRLSPAYCRGHKEKAMFAVTNETEWQSFLQVTDEARRMSAPVLRPDFDKNILIAVFQGWHSSGYGSYRIEITGLTETEDALRVGVKETIPCEKCNVTAAETTPCDLIEIEKTDKKIVFDVSENKIESR